VEDVIVGFDLPIGGWADRFAHGCHLHLVQMFEILPRLLELRAFFERLLEGGACVRLVVNRRTGDAEIVQDRGHARGFRKMNPTDKIRRQQPADVRTGRRQTRLYPPG
jgi:hypothetical protein